MTIDSPLWYFVAMSLSQGLAPPSSTVVLMVDEGNSQAEAPDSLGAPVSLGSGPGGSKCSWVGTVQVMVENVADITEGLDHVLREVEERAFLEVTGVAEMPISSGQVNSEGEKEREWLDVSPGKACRSPSRNKELKFGQVAILTNSRFAVLGSEEEGEIREDEDEAESLKDDESSCVAGKETVVVPHQSLPRESKMKHKTDSDEFLTNPSVGIVSSEKKNSSEFRQNFRRLSDEYRETSF
ncbi:hypothetical protein F2Q68_00008575 [Brassica cretica]|uniref:Uncharacterized protein n=1 Tax=Brassica cretica TaxID=69181 RepID=A0A8S9KZK4_BRACR|nr:hypothetical protein F2Q68_00008575 [Brassica cretica]